MTAPDPAAIPTPLGPMRLEVPCRICGEPARFPLAYCKPCQVTVLRGESVAPTVSVADGREGFATGVAPAGTNTEPNVGEQLDEIMRDLDRTGAAWAAAGYGYDTPEYEAREAVFRRLRAWNERVGAR